MLLLALLLPLVPPVRGAALRAAGAALVVSEDAARADAVALPSGIGPTGELEVADLVKSGVADRVVVVDASAAPQVAREYARRGVPLESQAERSRRLLVRLGVESARIEVLEIGQGGSTSEGAALARWGGERRIRTMIVVSSAHHSRRLRRVLGRSIPDGRVSLRVRVSRHDPFDPETWWQNRDNLRAGLVELQKLLLDYLAHPFS